MADAAQAFRMADEQMSARLQLLRQFSNQRFLRGPVEVNHHVAAENQLAALGEGISRLEQVQVLEPDVSAQLFAHTKTALPLADPALKIPTQQFRWNRSDFFTIVNGLLRPREHARGNIRGVNRPIPVQPEQFRQHDGQRVRFLAGGGGRAPRAEGFMFVMTAPPLRQQGRAQPVEMFFFAEEMGVVGGNDIHEVGQLLRVRLRFEPLAVFVVTGNVECAQALGHAAADERAFVRAEVDAAVFIDQAAQEFVIGVGERVGGGR